MRTFLVLSLTLMRLLYAERVFNTKHSVEEAFGGGNFSFDVDENWELCMTRNKTIEFDDTVEDYTKMLNETLMSLSQSGGGSVILTEGVFPITVPLSMPAKTCIIGQGKDITTLRVKDKSYPPYPFKGAIIAHKVDRVSLVGLTIDGNAQNQLIKHNFRALGRAGVYQERVRESYLLNVKSVNNYRHGFDLHGSDGRQAYHIAMAGCESSGNGGDGVRLDQAHYVGVTDSLVARNGRHGIAASTSAERFKIQNVQFIANGEKMRHGCGIHMDGIRHKGKDQVLRDIHIIGSAFRDSTLAGVCMRWVSEVNVTDSSIVNLEKSNSSCYYVRNVRALDIESTSCSMLSGTSFVPAKIKVERKAKAIPFGNSRGCPNGIAYFDVCCPMACGSCGKPGCARRGGKAGKNDGCCYSETKRFEEDCGKKGKAPCVLRNVGTKLN